MIMKGKALAAFISVLILSAIAGTHVNLAEANPAYKIIGHHDPDAETAPPVITILSLKNGTTYDNTLNLSFTVNVGESETAYKTMIMEVYYETDWLPNKVYLLNSYSNEYMLIASSYPSNFTDNVNLSEIPNGKHTITVYAREYGLYVVDESLYWFNSFSIDTSAVIQINKLPNSIDLLGIFTHETEPPPLISILSLENKTYNTSNISLNFTVNEAVSAIKYSLDGGENVTIAGNTTLTGLPNGEHAVTVYAIDETRNLGTTETFIFTIAEQEPFPMSLVTACASATIIGIGLMVYFKKRKHQKKINWQPVWLHEYSLQPAVI